MLKRAFLLISIFVATCAFATSAMAAASVSWLSPADGSTYLEGTVVNPSGQASGTGTTGGTGLDLMLVIDVSGSMSSGSWVNGVYKTRLDFAKEAAVALINSLPDNTTQVGIVAFDTTSDTAAILQDLTANKQTLINTVNNLSTGGLTNIGDAIRDATDELINGVNANADHAKMQVLLSDGADTTNSNPIGAAQDAALAGVTIHTVGISLTSSAASTMQTISSTTSGLFTNVNDLTQLEALFAGTGGNLVNLDRVEITLPDGTTFVIATDTLGNFILPDWVIQLGVNEFTAIAYDTEGNSATATLTLNGIGATNNPVPEPASLFLLGTGLLGLTGIRRKKKK